MRKPAGLERMRDIIQTYYKLIMRSLVITVLAVVIAATGMYSLVQADVFTRTCQTPISYRVGQIDGEFQISSSTVRELLSQSVSVWEENFNKDLFTYGSSSSDLVVNFTYDDRQRRTRARTEIADDLSSLADSHEGLTDSIDAKRQQYETVQQTYEQTRKRYEDRLASFNQRVDRWNQRDSVPTDVRSDLDAEREQLNQLRSSLEKVRTHLQQLRTDINRLAERSNSIAENYNRTAETFEDRFDNSQEFNQATYDGDTITVYQFNQADDLRLALTHEFGHALGIKHVSDAEAVMNRLMREQTLDEITLTAADKRALRKVCKQ